MAFETDKKVSSTVSAVSKKTPEVKKKEPIKSKPEKHMVDVSGIHMTFYGIVSALQEHYMVEEEDTTIQMQIHGICEIFESGDKTTAWKHVIKVLGNCIDVDLSQS